MVNKFVDAVWQGKEGSGTVRHGMARRDMVGQGMVNKFVVVVWWGCVRLGVPWQGKAW